MTRKGMAIASAVLLITMSASAIIVGSGLSDNARLPIHFGIDGDADKFADKWTALFMPTAIAAVVSMLFYWLPSMEPRQKSLERSGGLYLWSWGSALFLFATIELIIMLVALGREPAVNDLVVGALGLIFIFVGNQLGKSRSMYLVGIRTPWTLASEEVWIKTHRLAGKLAVAAGLIMILTTLLPLTPETTFFVALGGILIALAAPAAYSYVLWRRERHAQTRASLKCK